MSGPLTDAQLQVLALRRIATANQVARRVGTTVETVHAMLSDIRRRLDVATTEQAVQVALSRGWIR